MPRSTRERKRSRQGSSSAACPARAAQRSASSNSAPRCPLSTSSGDARASRSACTRCVCAEISTNAISPCASASSRSVGISLSTMVKLLAGFARNVMVNKINSPCVTRHYKAATHSDTATCLGGKPMPRRAATRAVLQRVEPRGPHVLTPRPVLGCTQKHNGQPHIGPIAPPRGRSEQRAHAQVPGPARPCECVLDRKHRAHYECEEPNCD